MSNRPVTQERVDEIMRLRADGASWQEVGRRCGISADWASQIIRHCRTLIREPRDTFAPIRTFGGCRWVCCHSPAGESGLCAEHARKAAGNAPTHPYARTN